VTTVGATAARAARIAAAVGAAALAAASLRTMHAEAAYETGLDASVDPRRSPALDLPGRLEAYEEAVRRDPGEELYVLRAGQVRLLRAVRRGGEIDGVELAAARGLLVRATELRPLDSRPRAQLARAARLAGDPDGAVAQARQAMALAPKAPGPMHVAVEIGLWAWRATGEPADLRTALAAGVALAGIGEESPDRAFAGAFAEARAGLAQDLVEATTGDAALAAYAVLAVRPVRPEAALVLDPPAPPAERER